MSRLVAKRSGRVKADFKRAEESDRNGCCAVCRWRPPRVLREIAGGLIGRLLHAHHVLPVACGGADHPDNLILVCPTHHAMAHHMGTAVGSRADGWRWDGPQNRQELLTCFVLLKQFPDEYRKLAKLKHNVARYVDEIHDEALIANLPRRGFTLDRGISLSFVGRRSA